MADKPKVDPVEEAHFRLDEHERKLDAIGKALTPETVAALVHGAVAAVEVSMKARFDELLEALHEDSKSDREVVGALRELIETLRMPTTRTAHLDLPSGPATMTVRESRDH